MRVLKSSITGLIVCVIVYLIVMIPYILYLLIIDYKKISEHWTTWNDGHLLGVIAGGLCGVFYGLLDFTTR